MSARVHLRTSPSHRLRAERTRSAGASVRATLSVVTFLAGALLSSPAAASNAAAAAEALFLEGRRALDGGRYEAACSKFRESHRLEPAAGTVMNLATCEERLGRLASAWQHWQEALQLLGPGDEREPFARRRLAALERELPYLMLRATPRMPAGAYFVRNGVRYDGGAFDTPLPVDPGKQVIVVGAPHHVPRAYHIEIERGARRSFVVRPGPPRRPRLQEDTGEAGARRTWAFVCGGAGIAGATTAVAAGLLLPNRRNAIDAHCDGDTCDSVGDTATHERQQLELARAIGWIVAGAGLGAGAYLFLTSHEPDAPPRLGADVAPDRALFTYSGTF